MTHAPSTGALGVLAGQNLGPPVNGPPRDSTAFENRPCRAGSDQLMRGAAAGSCSGDGEDPAWAVCVRLVVRIAQSLMDK